MTQGQELPLPPQDPGPAHLGVCLLRGAGEPRQGVEVLPTALARTASGDSEGLDWGGGGQDQQAVEGRAPEQQCPPVPGRICLRQAGLVPDNGCAVELKEGL